MASGETTNSPDRSNDSATGPREKSFVELKAAEQRAYLAEQLADWLDTGRWSSDQAEAFRRCANALARSLGIDRAELMSQLRNDAGVILDARDRSTRDRS